MRTRWELKCVGLVLISVYADFKFACAYRLFNYVAILFGGMLPVRDTARRRSTCHPNLARLRVGRHFNRGQRAFFFALGYLG